MAICLTQEVEIIILFITRASVTAAFQVLFFFNFFKLIFYFSKLIFMSPKYIFLQIAFVATPELYPTALRSSSIGLLSSLSRLGGLLTPFVVEVLMVEKKQVAWGLILYACVLTCGSIVSLLIPKETAGMMLESSSTTIVVGEEDREEKAMKVDGIEMQSLNDEMMESLTAKDSLQ